MKSMELVSSWLLDIFTLVIPIKGMANTAQINQNLQKCYVNFLHLQYQKGQIIIKKNAEEDSS